MEKIPTIPLLQAKIKNLEKCISDFKEYDEKRTQRIDALKKEVDEWKNRCFNLSDSLDELYLSIEEAKPAINRLAVKAIYFNMVQKLKNTKKQNGQLKKQIAEYLKTGNCDEILISKIADLQVKNDKYKQIINDLENVICNLKMKINNEK